MNNAIILLVVVMAILAVATATVVFYRALTALKEANRLRRIEISGSRSQMPTSQALIDLAKQGRPDWLYKERKDWQA